MTRLVLLPLLGLAVGCAPPDGAPSRGTAPEAAAPDTLRVEAPPDTTEGDKGWTLDPLDLPGSDVPALLVAVRHASHDAGYDRVVFEFEGRLPGIHVSPLDGPARQCGSGEAVPLEGGAALEIRLQPAQAHDDEGRATAPHERIGRALRVVREMVPTCDFESDVTWVLGLDAPRPYRALRLSDPDRLVVDVRHRGER